MSVEASKYTSQIPPEVKAPLQAGEASKPVGGHRRTLHAARWHPQLETRLLGEIRRQKAGDPLQPVTVLVPSNLTGLYLSRLMARHGFGHAGVRFVTLLDLSRRLGESSLAQRGLKPLPPQADLMLAAKAAGGLPANAYFNPVAASPGFHRALLATFQDLSYGGWTARVEGRPAGVPRGKVTELLGLFAGYRRDMGPRFYDYADLLAEAARHANDAPRVLGVRELLVYGLYDLTELQWRLLLALGQYLGLAVFVPAGDQDWHSFAQPAVRRLLAAGFTTAVEAEDAVEVAAEAGAAGAPRLPLTGGFTLLSAPDEAREVREVVRELLDLARGGMRFGEMAVLFRDRETYVPVLRERLAALGIPRYLPEGESLDRTAAGRGLLSALRLAAGGWPRAEVMEWITTAPISFERVLDGLAEPPLHLWDRMTAEAGIVRGRDQWVNGLRRLDNRYRRPAGPRPPGSSEPPDRWRDAATGLRRLVLRLLRDLGRFRGRANWRELADAALDFIDRYFAPDLPRLPEVRTVVDGLRALAEVQPGCDLAAFTRVLEEALTRARPPEGRLGEGVMVADVQGARGLAFRAVFILGLVEKGFPAPVRQDPLLLDHEREQLPAASLPLKRARGQEEALLFAAAVGSARERLVLSYPRAGALDGRAKIPSYYLSRIGEAALGRRPGYDELASIPGFRYLPGGIASPAVRALDEDEYDLASLAIPAAKPAAPGRGEPPPEAVVRSLRRHFPVLAAALEAADARRTTRLTVYDGALEPAGEEGRSLPPEERQSLALTDNSLAPTALETYATCPYRYFAGRLLALQPWEEPEEVLRILPVDRGQVLHRALELFFRGLATEGWLPLRPDRADEYRRRLLAAAEEAFAAAAREGVTGSPLIWDLDRATLREDLLRYLDLELAQEPGWVPTHFEVRFGEPETELPENSLPPLECALRDGSRVTFRGKIDRVDRWRDGGAVRVIDYKSGRLPDAVEDLRLGTGLQLPIYLGAARRLLRPSEQPGRDRSEAWYQSVSRGGSFQRSGVAGPDWPAVEEAFERALRTIVGGISAGHFFPYPGKNRRNCRRCDYRPLCGGKVQERFDRKAQDPAMAAFLALKGGPDE